jgi:hypothetical protein
VKTGHYSFAKPADGSTAHVELDSVNFFVVEGTIPAKREFAGDALFVEF